MRQEKFDDRFDVMVIGGGAAGPGGATNVDLVAEDTSRAVADHRVATDTVIDVPQLAMDQAS